MGVGIQHLKVVGEDWNHISLARLSIHGAWNQVGETFETRRPRDHQSQIGMDQVLKKIMSTQSHFGTLKVRRDKVAKSTAESRHPSGHSSEKTVWIVLM